MASHPANATVHDHKRHKVSYELQKNQTVDVDGKPQDTKEGIRKKTRIHSSKRNIASPHDGPECEICHKKFLSQNVLKVHMRTHLYRSKLPNKFQCKDCWKAFAKKYYLTYHRIKMHGCPQKTYKCQKCRHEFLLKKELYRHKFTHVKKLRCQVCRKWLTDGTTLMNHENYHRRESRYPCKLCPTKLDCKSHLERHMLIHSDKKNYECEMCGKKFIHLRNLKVHYIVHIEGSLFKCQFCNKKYRHKQTLREHLKLHLKPNRYQCKVCRKKLKYQSSLQLHLKQHDVGRIRDYNCPKCDKSFFHRENLRRHDQIVHLNLRPYICEVCNMTFMSKAHLKRHMFTHTKLKPHKCNICRRRFADKSNLKSHKSTHDKANRELFKCDICDILYSHKNTLKYHMKKHLEEIENTEYPCCFCDKVFRHSSGFRRHQKIHKVDRKREYECLKCKKAYYSKGHLQRHWRSAHSVKK